MADGIQRLTLTRENLHDINRAYDDGHRAQLQLRGSLGNPLNLCREWTRYRCDQARTAMVNMPQVIGRPSKELKGDGPNQFARCPPPVLAWLSEIGGPSSLEAIGLAESCRGGLNRGGDHAVLPPPPPLACCSETRPPPTPPPLLWPRFLYSRTVVWPAP